MKQELELFQDTGPGGDNLLSAEALRLSLPQQLRGLEIEIYSSIDSTNSAARRRIADHPNSPALILAETQTAGRGRRGAPPPQTAGAAAGGAGASPEGGRGSPGVLEGERIKTFPVP